VYVGLVLLLTSSIRNRRLRVSAWVAAAILPGAGQVFWLLPALGSWVDPFIKGTPLPPSRHHIICAVAEGV
jgi:hypothetical protein